MSDTLVFLAVPDPQQAIALASALTEPELQVELYGTGAELLDSLRRDAPDLVVLDAGLLDQDGFALCARLRLEALEGDLPVVMICDGGADDARARSAGADVVLAHPIDPVDLVAIVRSWLERRAERGGVSRLPLEPLPPLGRLDSGLVGRDDGQPREGEFSSAGFPGLVLDLFRRRFSGAIDIEAGDQQARVAFSQGHPVSVAMRDPATGIGRMLVEAGQLSSDQVGQVARAARRRGVPLGRLLVTHKLVDPVSLDCVLQLQTIRRMAAIRRFSEGQWRRSHQLAATGAGCPTHAAAVLWHMADVNVPVPPVSAEQEEHFIQAGAELEGCWHLFDPQGRAGGLRLVLLGGGRVADARQLGGDRVLPLLAVLAATGVISIGEEPPDAARRATVLARADLEPFREQLEATYSIASGADAYTLLGVAPAAPVEEIEAAAGALMDRYRPETLPGGLSAAERARAAELHRQALRARRLLGHPRRRGAHDYLMASVDTGGQLGEQVLDHAIFHAEHARRLYRRGDYAAAAQMLGTALQLEGETADLLAMLGQALHRANPGVPAAGEAELRRALRRDPQHPLAHLYLGRLLAARGERDAALAMLRRAELLAPQIPAVREALRRLELGQDVDAPTLGEQGLS
jgi:DNA-binding response OmpR family regulator/tetratricopeptide (TPR) repeat protein